MTRGAHAVLCLLLVFALSACSHPTAADRALDGTRTPVADPELSANELFDKGRQLAARGDLVRAEQYLALAGSHGYAETDVLRALLVSCIAASRLRAALDHTDRFLSHHPRRWRVRLVRASLLDALGNAALARHELEAIVTLQPQAALPHYHLGLLLARAPQRSPHDRLRALRHLKAAARLAPHAAFADPARVVAAQLAAQRTTPREFDR